ncbi:hypothetical protein MTO96_004086 [Rhipicephalus appendiculatus]
MLRHFEHECTFHSVECFRCGEAVLHIELATHYVAGCSTGVSSERTENASSESRALTLQDVANASEEEGTPLIDPNHDQVPTVIQNQENELTEQVWNHDSTLAENTGEIGSSLSAERAQHAAASFLDCLSGTNSSATSSG